MARIRVYFLIPLLLLNQPWITLQRGLANQSAKSHSTIVTISGRQVLVNGEPFIVKGVGYAPTPIGQDPAFPPNGNYFTTDYHALYSRDLSLLRQMGANMITADFPAQNEIAVRFYGKRGFRALLNVYAKEENVQ